ncbi:MAG: ANTAR domain-containing response regulator [Armatimonadota bacterium]
MSKVSQECSPGGGKRARVLVCEDEGLTALRLQTSLKKLGYEVVGEARDGEEAVAAAARLQPDAILMDIRMPKLDGVGATEQIMASRPTAIVMITAYSERELVESALRAGASGYLVKPVSDEQIEPALRVALSRFSELNDLREEVSDLKGALEARKQMERAKGILMRRYQITEEEAYKRLQKVSRDRRQSLKETAEKVIAAAELLG